jgi:hypothetical protein
MAAATTRSRLEAARERYAAARPRSAALFEATIPARWPLP